MWSISGLKPLSLLYLVPLPPLSPPYLAPFQVLNDSYDIMDCADFPSVSLEGNVTIGQIRECLINNVFNGLRQSDVYRSAVCLQTEYEQSLGGDRFHPVQNLLLPPSPVLLRYAFGIVVASLSLVVVLLVFVGVAMGLLGFRRNREPTERTRLSHCGGIILVM